jgi:hypothetical protein
VDAQATPQGMYCRLWPLVYFAEEVENELLWHSVLTARFSSCCMFNTSNYLWFRSANRQCQYIAVLQYISW